jgi:hypothetical protein
MPIAPDKIELYGRLYLLSLALEEVSELMFIASKIEKHWARVLIDVLDNIEREDRAAFDRLRGSAPFNSNDWLEFRRAPSYHDTLRARLNLYNLAAVLFCQLEAKGNGHAGHE